MTKLVLNCEIAHKDKQFFSEGDIVSSRCGCEAAGIHCGGDECNCWRAQEHFHNAGGSAQKSLEVTELVTKLYG